MIRRLLALFRRGAAAVRDEWRCMGHGHDWQRDDLYASTQEPGYRAVLEAWMNDIEPGERVILDRRFRRCQRCGYVEEHLSHRIVLYADAAPPHLVRSYEVFGHGSYRAPDPEELFL